MPTLSAKKAALMSEAVRKATARRVLGTEEDYQKGGRFHEHGLGHVKVELSPVHENVMIQKSFGSFPEFCKTVCARTIQQTADLRARRRLTLTRFGPVCWRRDAPLRHGPVRHVPCQHARAQPRLVRAPGGKDGHFQCPPPLPGRATPPALRAFAASAPCHHQVRLVLLLRGHDGDVALLLHEGARGGERRVPRRRHAHLLAADDGLVRLAALSARDVAPLVDQPRPALGPPRLRSSGTSPSAPPRYLAIPRAPFAAGGSLRRWLRWALHGCRASRPSVTPPPAPSSTAGATAATSGSTSTSCRSTAFPGRRATLTPLAAETRPPAVSKGGHASNATVRHPADPRHCFHRGRATLIPHTQAAPLRRGARRVAILR